MKPSRCLLVAIVLTTFAGSAAAQVEVPTGLTPAGVFTTLPTAEAFTTTAVGGDSFIESGAGFLWFDETNRDGPAIGFNQLLRVFEGTNRSDYDSAAFFAQDGIPIIDPLDSGVMIGFSRWEIDPATDDKPETVSIFGPLFNLDGEQVDISGDGSIGPDDDVSLSGFIFSPEPVGRDLIPREDDGIIDHIEYVDSDWDAQLVDDVTSFLQITETITPVEAAAIRRQFVPEPSTALLALSGAAALCLRRRRSR